MTSSNVCIHYEFFYRLLRKLYEDVFEAYNRTPPVISSRPHIERALRLAEAGLAQAYALVRECKRARVEGEVGPGSNRPLKQVHNVAGVEER
ncbi:hypothetical protein [Hyperthermus butylicus]|uniref:hypothetical protein n=1 Tax=Hyperthermus butylicus TaxID=54248 RepID=UPI000321C165|nr:hypothetical protein [Hyperthermus butylicus]